MLLAGPDMEAAHTDALADPHKEAAYSVRLPDLDIEVVHTARLADMEAKEGSFRLAVNNLGRLDKGSIASCSPL